MLNEVGFKKLKELRVKEGHRVKVRHGLLQYGIPNNAIHLRVKESSSFRPKDENVLSQTSGDTAVEYITIGVPQ